MSLGADLTKYEMRATAADLESRPSIQTTSPKLSATDLSIALTGPRSALVTRVRITYSAIQPSESIDSAGTITIFRVG
jgi:hypothetical protein